MRVQEQTLDRHKKTNNNYQPEIVVSGNISLERLHSAIGRWRITKLVVHICFGRLFWCWHYIVATQGRPRKEAWILARHYRGQKRNGATHIPLFKKTMLTCVCEDAVELNIVTSIIPKRSCPFLLWCLVHTSNRGQLCDSGCIHVFWLSPYFPTDPRLALKKQKSPEWFCDMEFATSCSLLSAAVLPFLPPFPFSRPPCSILRRWNLPMCSMDAVEWKNKRGKDFENSDIWCVTTLSCTVLLSSCCSAVAWMQACCGEVEVGRCLARIPHYAAMSLSLLSIKRPGSPNEEHNWHWCARRHKRTSPNRRGRDETRCLVVMIRLKTNHNREQVSSFWAQFSAGFLANFPDFLVHLQ